MPCGQQSRETQSHTPAGSVCSCPEGGRVRKGAEGRHRPRQGEQAERPGGGEPGIASSLHTHLSGLRKVPNLIIKIGKHGEREPC